MPAGPATPTTSPIAAGEDRHLTPVVFSTAGADGRHQLDLWLSKYESFNRLQVLEAGDEGFAARNEIWNLGDFALLRNTGPAVRFARTARHIRRDSVDHWVIRLALVGQSRLRSGESVLAPGPGTPLLFSLGDPFEGDRTEADWLSIYIPRDRFPDLSLGLGRLGPRAIETPGAALLSDYIQSLARRLPEMTVSQVPMLVQATRSMIAACLLATVDPRAVTPQDSATAQFETVRRIIRQHLASPTLGPEKICRIAGMSRSQLYRLFEPHGGVARYVQRLRLQRVHAALADPANARQPIAALAEREGFFDASAFSRVFRREFGHTPREARIAAGAGLLPPGAGASLANPAQAGDFSAILRQLGTMGRAAPMAAEARSAANAR